MRPRWPGRGASRAALALLVGLVAPALAEENAAPPPGGTVSLDKLLQLPDSSGFDVERRAGATRSEWRARFFEAQTSIDRAREALAESLKQQAKTANKSDAWSVAPPGLPAEASGEALEAGRLREDVKRKRAEVERAESRMRELDIEANLAGVPADWRAARTEASPGNDSVSEGPAPR
jgi:hypothetical protein